MGSLIAARNRILTQSPHLETASGQIVTFNASIAAPLKSLRVDFAPIQAGSGDPSPENVRPISGWTSVLLIHTNENLIGGETLAESILTAMPATTIDRTAQTVTFTGRTNGDGNKTLVTLPFITGQQYTAILRGSGNIKNIRWQYTDGTYDTASQLPSWGGAYVSTAGKTVRRLIKVYNSASQTILNYGTSCILAGVKTAADFQPYLGETVDIDWTDEAGEVYGGYVDFVKGELVDTYCNADLASLTWRQRTTSAPYIYSADFSVQFLTEGINSAEQFCDYFPVSYVTGMTRAVLNHLSLYRYGPSTPSDTTCYLAFSDITSLSELNTWLGNNHPHACYRRATNISYNLTPQQIKTLCGTNNIFSDAGITTVKYWTH